MLWYVQVGLLSLLIWSATGFLLRDSASDRYVCPPEYELDMSWNDSNYTRPMKTKSCFMRVSNRGWYILKVTYCPVFGVRMDKSIQEYLRMGQSLNLAAVPNTLFFVEALAGQLAGVPLFHDSCGTINNPTEIVCTGTTWIGFHCTNVHPSSLF